VHIDKSHRVTNQKHSRIGKNINEKEKTRPPPVSECYDSPECSYDLIVTFPLQVHTIPAVSKIYASSCLHLMVHTLIDVGSPLAEPTE
jgi:hypothetical protein